MRKDASEKKNASMCSLHAPDWDNWWVQLGMHMFPNEGVASRSTVSGAALATQHQERKCAEGCVR